jgi:hypothetical protein
MAGNDDDTWLAVPPPYAYIDKPEANPLEDVGLPALCALESVVFCGQHKSSKVALAEPTDTERSRVSAHRRGIGRHSFYATLRATGTGANIDRHRHTPRSHALTKGRFHKPEIFPIRPETLSCLLHLPLTGRCGALPTAQRCIDRFRLRQRQEMQQRNFSLRLESEWPPAALGSKLESQPQPCRRDRPRWLFPHRQYQGHHHPVRLENCAIPNVLRRWRTRTKARACQTFLKMLVGCSCLLIYNRGRGWVLRL